MHPTRPLDAIQSDVEALARPRFPFSALGARTGQLGPLGGQLENSMALWRAEIAAWRATYPDREERYEALLAEMDAAERSIAEDRARREAIKAWGARHLPRRVAAVLEAGADESIRAIDAAKRWLESPKPWLVLLGSSGQGKSISAAWALRRCAEKGATVAWAQADTLAVLAGGFGGEERAERLRHVDVLVMDDVGTEHQSEFARSVMRGILQARHEDLLRTIVTSNHAGAEFRETVGVRLARRIRDECVAVELTGEPLKFGQPTNSPKEATP
jgi:DNA replication protein DnaC